MRQYRLLFFILALFVNLSSVSYAQTFTEVSSSVGVTGGTDDMGAAWADYDHDGDLDLYVGTFNAVADRLFQNDGDGTFTEVTVSAGINNTQYTLGVAWADYDNDGDLDIYINNNTGSRKLYQNDGDGTFTEVAVAAGVSSSSGTSLGAAWADYDSDGDVDLYVALDTANKLFDNDGDGTFTEVGNTAGVDYGAVSSTPAWGDYDNDGHIDLYLTTSAANVLYANNGDGTFTDVASAKMVNVSGIGRGVAWADYDNDGDIDLYHAIDSGGTNVLYQNNGDGSFTEVGATAGVNSSGSDYGVAWGDYNNDGYLDLAVMGTTDYLYENDGDGTFTDVASAKGLTDSGTFGAAWGDYDNDGDLDLYAAGTTDLFENSGNANRWLVLELRNTVGNRIGTQVTAVTGSLRQIREVDGGSGIYSQPSIPLEFGFGSTTTVDSLIIEWHSGQIEILTNVSTNQVLTQYEPVSVSIPNFSASTDTIQVPIQVSNTTNAGIVSADIFVTFDNSVADFISTDLTGTLAATGWNTVENVVSGVGGIDTLKIVMFTAQDALVGAGDLINLSFDLSGSSGATSLDIVHAVLNNGLPPTDTQGATLSATGTNGTVSAVPDTIIPSQTVTITVVDQDENTHNSFIDSFQVLTFESVYADSEMVWLFETGPASNTFTNTLTTEYNTSGTVSDGVMSVVAGDSITVVYSDVLDSGGSPVDRIAYVQIIGGIDGVVSTTPAVITAGTTITLSVTDADEDVNVGAVDSVFVQLFTIAHADTESVWLQETGVNTGAFSGTFLTEYNTSATVADNMLSVALNDSICLAYVDSLGTAGNVVTRNAYTQVIPYDDGTLQVSYVVQALDGQGGVRDTVRVRVFDADLDLDVGTPDQASVTITNVVSAEAENLTLTETGNNTGIFELRVPTVQGASGTDNNGVLTIASWDTLEAVYFDALTSTAVSNTLRDTTYVANLFGDSQSNDAVQGFDASKILNISIGSETASFQDSLVSDVNGDGFILALDATYVSQYIVNIIDRFAIQTDSTFSSPSDSLKNHPFLKPALGQPVIAFGDPLRQTDGTYVLPVTLGERADVLSGTFQIGHDPNIEILNVRPATPFQNHVFVHNPQKDNVRVAFSGIKSKESGQGDVFFIQLRTQNDVPIHLTLDSAFLNGQDVFAPVEVIEQVIQQSVLPEVYALHPNAPNPFNPDTVIRYDMPESAQVQIVIYNVMGQQVRTLVSAHQEAGRYQVTWNGKDDLNREVSSGIYLMRMQTESFVKMQKMLLLK